MQQPYQSNPSNGNPPTLPLEVRVVADRSTAAQLTRATVLGRWRSPRTWAYIATIPLVLMARVIILVILNTSRSGPANLFVTYFGLLLVTIVFAVLITALRMVRPLRQVVEYASPGSTITVRYQQNSLDVVLTNRTVSIDYGKIVELYVIGNAVHLRPRGMHPISLPRELFPDAALNLMRRDIQPLLPTGRTLQLDRVTAGLLLAVAILLIPASFLTQIVESGAGLSSSEKWQAWEFVFESSSDATETRLRLLGAAYAVAGVVATVAGVLLFRGRGAQRPAVRRLGVVAASLAFGVTVTSALEAKTAIAQGNIVVGHTAGVGFWPLVIAAVVASVALAASLIGAFPTESAGQFAVPSAPDGRSVTDKVGAWLLGFAGASAIASSFTTFLSREDWGLTAWHYAYGSDALTPFVGIPLLLTGLTALGAAVMAGSGRLPSEPISRTATLSASSLLFGSALTLGLNTLSHRMVLGFSFQNFAYYHLGAGFWILCGATILAGGAVISNWIAFSSKVFRIAKPTPGA